MVRDDILTTVLLPLATAAGLSAAGVIIVIIAGIV
jgi:hypothetical protein